MLQNTDDKTVLLLKKQMCKKKKKRKHGKSNSEVFNMLSDNMPI